MDIKINIPELGSPAMTVHPASDPNNKNKAEDQQPTTEKPPADDTSSKTGE